MTGVASPSLDQERVGALAMAMLTAVRAHMMEGPRDREKVLECLNALAVTAATMIAGTEDYYALEFFMDALNQNITDIMSHHANAPTHAQG